MHLEDFFFRRGLASRTLHGGREPAKVLVESTREQDAPLLDSIACMRACLGFVNKGVELLNLGEDR